MTVGVISQATVRFTNGTPSGVVDEIAATVARGATYKFVFRFDGFGNPALARELLVRHSVSNPFSVLELILESGDGSEASSFLDVTGELPLRQIPCFDLYSRFPNSRELHYPSQLSRRILCPARRCAEMAAAGLRGSFARWASVAGSPDEIKAGIRTAARHNWNDGLLICNRELSRQEQIFLPLYFHFLLGRSIAVHFEDPVASAVYRTCLRQECAPSQGPPEFELRYRDGAEPRLEALRETIDSALLEELYRGVTTAMGTALEFQLADALV